MTDTKTSTAKRNCDGQPSLAPATFSAASVHFSSATPEWSTPQEFFDDEIIDHVRAEYSVADEIPAGVR
jgi:hypothetical protein